MVLNVNNWWITINKLLRVVLLNMLYDWIISLQWSSFHPLKTSVKWNLWSSIALSGSKMTISSPYTRHHSKAKRPKMSTKCRRSQTSKQEERKFCIGTRSPRPSSVKQQKRTLIVQVVFLSVRSFVPLFVCLFVLSFVCLFVHLFMESWLLTIKAIHMHDVSNKQIYIRNKQKIWPASGRTLQNFN